MSTSQLVGPPPGVASFPFLPGEDRGTVEDLYLYLDRPVRPPVRVAGFGSSASGTPQLQFEDAGSTPLFDTAGADAYTARAWGGGFTLHRWRRGVERLEILTRSGLDPHAPAGNRLDERAWGSAPPSVRVLVVNGVEVDAGRVVLEGGCNLAVTADPAAGAVTLAAVSGAGAGACPDCGPGDPLLRTVNRTGPTEAGAFALTAADCLAVAAAEAGLTVSGDCRPCLDCDDLKRVYLALKQADAAGSQLSARLAAVIQQYNDAVDRWNAQKACREAQPVRIALAPYRSGGTTCATITVGYCNSTPSCLADVHLTLTWSSPVVGQLVSGSGVLYPPTGPPVGFTPAGAWPTYTVGFGSMDPGRSARVKLSFCFPGGLPGQTATLTAAAAAGGAPSLGSAQDTVTFV